MWGICHGIEPNGPELAGYFDECWGDDLRVELALVVAAKYGEPL
jgi:hypothetical protein